MLNFKKKALKFTAFCCMQSIFLFKAMYFLKFSFTKQITISFTTVPAQWACLSRSCWWVWQSRAGDRPAEPHTHISICRRWRRRAPLTSGPDRPHPQACCPKGDEACEEPRGRRGGGCRAVPRRGDRSGLPGCYSNRGFVCT